MKFLVDTDWIIKFLRGHKKTVEILSRLYNEGFAISIISFSEVYEGIYRFEDTKREELEKNFQDFLTGVQILNIDENIGKIFAEQRAKLRKENKLGRGAASLYAELPLECASTICSHSKK